MLVPLGQAVGELLGQRLALLVLPLELRLAIGGLGGGVAGADQEAAGEQHAMRS